MIMTYKKRIVALILPALIFSIQTPAQPSGGPYGPVRQTYQLPMVTGKIYYVAPDGETEASGEMLTAPTTIEKAIEQVKTGDAIVMRGGTYRTGNLEFNQGITIQPYQDEQPVLKGTYVASDWKDLGNGLWTTKWAHLFPQKPADWWQRDRSGKQTPIHRFNDDIDFVDGKWIKKNLKLYYIFTLKYMAIQHLRIRRNKQLLKLLKQGTKRANRSNVKRHRV